jgi:xylan 1,4-beta-xylosidase
MDRKSIPRISLWLAAAVIAGGLASAARADEAPLRKVSIDATVTVGALRPLNGVQAAGAEGAAFYKSARVDLVRIHNVSGAGDVAAIFPDMSADAEDPKSYQFAATDRLVASIKSGGAEPLFRIGRNSDAAEPPADPDKWAQIARHIVLHYNQGWDRGFHYRIRYWEIWNAPDSKLSWNGSPEEYYSLYEKTARAIEAADAEALVGGPALAKPLIGGAYREKFLDFVRMHRLPLDFFSWHFYTLDADDPYSFVPIARQLRVILDSHGLGSTKNILDEWNADPSEHDATNASQAAFAASALIYMLGGPFDAQTYHRAAAELRGKDGETDSVGRTLSAFGTLKSTPVLIRTEGGDDAGFAIVAGRSQDRRLIQIMISNYQIAAKYLQPRDNWDTTLPERRILEYHDNGGYDATITLARPGRYQVKRYRINDAMNFALVDQSVQTGATINLRAALAPPGVEFIVISAD